MVTSNTEPELCKKINHEYGHLIGPHVTLEGFYFNITFDSIYHLWTQHTETLPYLEKIIYRLKNGKFDPEKSSYKFMVNLAGDGVLLPSGIVEISPSFSSVDNQIEFGYRGKSELLVPISSEPSSLTSLVVVRLFLNERHEYVLRTAYPKYDNQGQIDHLPLNLLKHYFQHDQLQHILPKSIEYWTRHAFSMDSANLTQQTVKSSWRQVIKDFLEKISFETVMQNRVRHRRSNL
ncbi:MAG: hypothetical protein OHK0017_04560 [Patescibacteria group bacterium]